MELTRADAAVQASGIALPASDLSTQSSTLPSRCRHAFVNDVQRLATLAVH